MATLTLLGTGAAYTDPHRTTTMLAVSEGTSTLLIDCGGDVVQRCLAAGIPLDTIDGIYLTHEHPDHVSGFPLFIEKIWLAGRSRPIDFYGIAPALDQARRAFATYDTSHWSLPEFRWHEVDHREGATVLDNDTWSIQSTPGVHSVPVTGLRIKSLVTGGVLAYSCDTERCDSIIALSEGADLLVHEASGPFPGHASVEDAVHVARAAGVSRMILVHLPPGTQQSDLIPYADGFDRLEFGDELQQVSF